MFPADEAPVVEGMLANYFGGSRKDDHVCVADVREAVCLEPPTTSPSPPRIGSETRR